MHACAEVHVSLVGEKNNKEKDYTWWWGNNPGKHKPAGGGEGERMGGWTRGRQQTVGETQKKHDQRQQQKDDRGD